MRLPPARLSNRDMLSFTGQLARLYEGGVPLQRGLELLAGCGHSRELRRTAELLAWHTARGASLGEAVKSEQGRFPDFFVTLVGVAERWGGLDDVFQQVHAWYEERRRIALGLMRQFAYPLAVLVAAFIGVPLVRLFLLFTALGNIPLFMPALRILLSGLTPLALVVVCVLAYRRSRFAQMLLFTAVAHVWPFSRIFGRFALSRFAWTLAMESRMGVPAGHALHHAAALLPHGPLRARLRKAAYLLNQGQGWSQALGGVRGFPAPLRQAVDVGEEAGRMDEMLEGAARDYFKKAVFLTNIVITSAGAVALLFIAYLVFGGMQC